MLVMDEGRAMRSDEQMEVSSFSSAQSVRVDWESDAKSKLDEGIEEKEDVEVDDIMS